MNRKVRLCIEQLVVSASPHKKISNDGLLRYSITGRKSWLIR
jgi:hypothetical protein